jgi:uroporphyrinogen-III synthase
MRVLVTRQREQAGPLVEALVARGFDAVVEPLICTQSLSDAPISVEGYDCVIVTSPNGARELARRREGRPAFLAAIGPGTAAALKQEGLQPDLTAAEHTQEGLVAALDVRPRRALFVGAEGARSVLADELDAEFVAAYRTIERIPAELPDVDLVVLMSPSAASAYAAAGGRGPAISIGPQTTARARTLGVEVVAEARSHDLDGLVDCAAAWRDASSPS